MSGIFGVISQGVVATGSHAVLAQDKRFGVLMADCCERLTKVPEWFGVRQIMSIAHSIGKLNICNDTFFDAVAREHARIVQDGNSHALSNIVWAFATTKHKSNSS